MSLLFVPVLHLLACSEDIVTPAARTAAPAAEATSLRQLPTAIAVDARAFAASPTGFAFDNGKWGLRGQLDAHGAHFGAEDSAFSMTFSAWGRANDLVPVEPVSPELGGCGPELLPSGECSRLVEFGRMGITEWWSNREAGVEQGWTLDERPDGDGPVVVDVVVEGADVEGDAAEVYLTTASGQAWRYSALAAWDSRGDALDAWFELDDGVIRIVVDDTDALWPIMIDPLLTIASTTLDGEAASNAFGYAVEGAGDVNADGYDDLIVGAYGYSSNTGRAYVFHGSSSGISSTAAATLTGSSASSFFGAAVRGVGDVNNDGYGDVAVGAYGLSEATVYFGSSAGITTTGAVTLSGSSSSTGFGVGVGAADVNGDGYSDVLVGEYKYTTNYGRLSVYHGSAAFDSTADTQIGGGVASYFGWAVDGAGDVDDDGYEDVVVGAYYFSSYKGRAYVFHGSSSGLSTSPTTTLAGGSSNYYLGFDVAGAGDVNADGYSDIIVGMYGYSSSTGRAHIYHGSSTGVDTTVDLNLTGVTAAAEYGFAVDGGFDVDNDGYSDVIVGERKQGGNVGAAYVYRGSASGIDSTADTTLAGTSGAQFGRSVAALGDVNGDGYGDAGVGGSSLTSSTGRVWVFHGYVDEDGDGYYVGGEGTDEDCDDTDVTVNPGATEAVDDGVDQDCDGAELCYEDGDDDGYRTSSTVSSADTDCTDAGEGSSADPDDDCDDALASVNPGASEVVGDGVDNYCDGSESCFADADNDGYTTSSTVASADSDCGDSGEGTSTDPSGDCDDTRSTINPGKSETVGNNYDENCDGSASCYADADVDGYRTSTVIASADTDCGDAGEARSVTASGDCDDTNAAISPASTEVCDGADADEDCDGSTDDADTSTSAASKSTFYTDADLDSYGDPAATSLACDPSFGVVADSSDCNDADASVNPGAPEVCDGADVDENCNGLADDDDTSASGGGTWYTDSDSDSYGDAAATITSCDAPPGYVAVAGDCNDAAASISPGSAETVGDSIDADCDGTELCYVDGDGDVYHNDGQVSSADVDCSGTGEASYTAPGGDCDDADPTVNPGATEAAGDEVDSDCDGTELCFSDADLDGYSSSDGATVSSADVDCTASGEASSLTPGGDCDDADAAYNPGALEACDDTVDYNCDGSVSYEDNDGDGVAACNDCDDANSLAYPGAVEVVGNGVDEDCDGGEICYVDADDDGTRVDDTTVASADVACDGVGEADASSISGDCNDADPAYYPGAVEADCTDPNDYNCDGSVGYADADGDGFVACEECDDLNALVNPDGVEVCNDLDDDCNGAVDDAAFDATEWYADEDADTYGNAEVTTQSCDAPVGYVSDSSDCDDQAATVNPSADEVANDGIDQDCDGADLEEGDTGDTGNTGSDNSPPDSGNNNDVDDVSGGGGCGCDTPDGSGAAAGAALLLAGVAISRRRKLS